MPRTRSLAWSELKIGLITIAALVIAGIMIFLVSGEGGFFWQRYPLKTKFANIQGLKPGAPVRVAGVEVGTVKRLTFAGDQVEVEFEVSKEQQPRITTASIASLGSVSLLGEAAVDITAASSGTPVPPDGYVPSGRGPGQISDVATQATEGLAEATRLLTEIRAGRGTMGKLFTDEGLFNEINELVTSAQTVATNLRAGKGTMGQLATNPQAYKSLEASLKNLDAMTSRINRGEGSLGRLLNDEALAKSVTATTANLETLTGRLNKGEGTAGKLLTDDVLYTRLNSLTDRLDKVTSSLQAGEGTAGQLLRDRQLYENMNGAVAELRNLVKDIRADPKKFLTVRVSIF